MKELTEAMRESLLASAQKHEEAAKEIRAVIDRLTTTGYTVYANELTKVVVGMIRHVDGARDLARKS